MKRKSPEDKRREKRLHAKRERRRLKKRAWDERQSADRPGRSHFLGPSYVLTAFSTRLGKHRHSSVTAGRATLQLPRVFSFIDEPGAALGALYDLIGHARDPKVDEIFIDSSQCSAIDHGAESALNAIVLELRRLRTRSLRFAGRFPVDKKLQMISMAVGTPSVLGVNLPEPDGFLKFPLTKGSSGGTAKALTSSGVERIATDLTVYLERCLANYGWRLKVPWRRDISMMIAEILNNSGEHGGHGEWWVAGYLYQPKGQAYGDCRLTLFNFGKSIAESLNDLPETSALRKGMDGLVDRHSAQGLFGPSWNRETLWTVYALQEGVSRHNTEVDALGHRGVGTVKIIETFQRLGRSPTADLEPEMCVLSGATHIRFDGSYKMQEKQTNDGESRSIIAFNSTNDLEAPPDSNCVASLAHHFPGTLISIRFFLDAVHLNALGEP